MNDDMSIKKQRVEQLYDFCKQRLSMGAVTAKDFVKAWVNHIPEQPLDAEDTSAENLSPNLKNDDEMTVLEPSDSASNIGSLGRVHNMSKKLKTPEANVKSIPGDSAAVQKAVTEVLASALLGSAEKRRKLFENPLKTYASGSGRKISVDKARNPNLTNLNSMASLAKRKCNFDADPYDLQFITFDESTKLHNSTVNSGHVDPEVAVKSVDSKNDDRACQNIAGSVTEALFIVPDAAAITTPTTSEGTTKSSRNTAKQTTSSCYKTAFEPAQSVSTCLKTALDNVSLPNCDAHETNIYKLVPVNSATILTSSTSVQTSPVQQELADDTQKDVSEMTVVPGTASQESEHEETTIVHVQAAPSKAVTSADDNTENTPTTSSNNKRSDRTKCFSLNRRHILNLMRLKNHPKLGDESFVAHVLAGTAAYMTCVVDKLEQIANENERNHVTSSDLAQLFKLQFGKELKRRHIRQLLKDQKSDT